MSPLQDQHQHNLVSSDLGLDAVKFLLCFILCPIDGCSTKIALQFGWVPRLTRASAGTLKSLAHAQFTWLDSVKHQQLSM